MKLTNCVYRFLNKDGEVIYIGKAKNLENRIKSHEHLPKECYLERYKIEYCTFETEDDMDFAERYFIPKYNPKYNTVLKDKSITFEISELNNVEWMLFKEYKKETSLTVEELSDIRELIDIKDLLLDVVNNKRIMCSNTINIIQTGETKQKMFRIDADVLDKWNGFCERNSEMKVQNLISTALLEFMKNYN